MCARMRLEEDEENSMDVDDNPSKANGKKNTGEVAKENYNEDELSIQSSITASGSG